MKIGIITGSNRKESQSGRIAKFSAQIMQKQHQAVELASIDLSIDHVPTWREEKWTGAGEVFEAWQKYSDLLRSCDGFIFVVPEWAGMVPPEVKNLLLMCEKGELAHKPAILIAISASMGGAYPIAELRMSGYKNNFLIWLPDHIILRFVQNLFNEDAETDLDIELCERMEYAFDFLVAYAKSCAEIRRTHLNLDKYPFGM